MKADPTSERTSIATNEAQTQAERLSAWMDGELDAPATEAVLRQLLSGRHLQGKYQSWCVVGDALRSHEVAAQHSPRLCARISRALQDEPVLLAPRALSSARLRHQLASGAAVAAAIAVVVLVAVPLLRGTVPSPGVATNAVEAPRVAPAELAGRDTNALNALNPVPAASVRQPRLDPYFQAHRDFTAEGVMPAAAIYLRSGNESER
ncbi:MAG TPA: sigma-E factor negative regulatory protein [Burkholderiaceae bacterium]|nr:sigma-E factor negative regulatory protein [Burkholderiaceae bacterium]